MTLSCDYPGSYVEAWDKGKFHVSLSSPSSACNCQLTSNGSASVLVFPNVTDMDFDEYSCNAQIGPGVTCTAVANISKAGKCMCILNCAGTASLHSTCTFKLNMQTYSQSYHYPTSMRYGSIRITEFVDRLSSVHLDLPMHICINRPIPRLNCV